MPTRNLPRTQVTRMHVLRQASLKGNGNPAASHPFSAAHFARINLNSPTSAGSIFAAALVNLSAKEQALSASTDTTAALLTSQLRLVSHFFQVLDLAIVRGDWPPATREYHGRDKTAGPLPRLTTYDDAVVWSGHIQTGETERASDEGAGFIAMSNPTAARVQTGATALTAALLPHSNYKTALIDAQQAVENLLPGPTGIDQLLLDHYDEVEHFYRNLPDGARRDQCRQWGLLYEGDTVPDSPGGGGSSSSSSSSSSTEALTAVQNLIVQSGSIGSGSVSASWDANPAGQAVGFYEVLRDGAVIATTADATTTTLELTGFEPGASVTLTVRARRGPTTGPQSEPVTNTAG